MIYLASPYSDLSWQTRDWRWRRVCSAAASLMRKGYIIFSPIAHTRPIAAFGLPGGWDFWERFDREFIAAAAELWVLTLPGWEESKGVQAEIQIAVDAGKPVFTVDPVTLRRTLYIGKATECPQSNT